MRFAFDARDILLKKLHTVVAVLGIAVASGTAWWWQNRPDKAPAAAAASTGPQARTGAPDVRPPGGSGGPGGQGGPAAVEVAKAESIRLTDEVQAIGSLKSVQGVMLRPSCSLRTGALENPVTNDSNQSDYFGQRDKSARRNRSALRIFPT